MDGVIYIVIIAAVLLVSMFVYDKRYSIATFFKEKVAKPKEFQIPKVKEKPKEDPDEIPNQGRVNYGDFELDENLPKGSDLQNFEVENIFEQDDEEEDDEMDLDQMYEELRREETKKFERHYKSDNPDKDLPDFDNMSIDDLDDFLQNNIDDSSSDDFSGYGNFSDEMSGEELANAIKNLPRPLKILIASDILKRKDW